MIFGHSIIPGTLSPPSHIVFLNPFNSPTVEGLILSKPPLSLQNQIIVLSEIPNSLILFLKIPMLLSNATISP